MKKITESQKVKVLKKYINEVKREMMKEDVMNPKFSVSIGRINRIIDVESARLPLEQKYELYAGIEFNIKTHLKQLEKQMNAKGWS